MKAATQPTPAHVASAESLILSIGNALRVALAKIFRTKSQQVKPYGVEEIVDMKSPRMQRALKLVEAINNCTNDWDVRTVRAFIENFNHEYPEPNPLMSFLENKAWDIAACKRINDMRARQQLIRIDLAQKFSMHMDKQAFQADPTR